MEALLNSSIQRGPGVGLGAHIQGLAIVPFLTNRRSTLLFEQKLMTGPLLQELQLGFTHSSPCITRSIPDFERL